METNKEKYQCINPRHRETGLLFPCKRCKPLEPQVDKQQEIRKDWKTAFKKGFVWEQDGNRGLQFFRITNELDWAKHPDKEKFIGNRTLVQPEYLEAFIEEAVSQAIEQNEAKTRLEISSEISRLVLKTTDIKTMNVLEDLQKWILEGINQQ